MAEETKTPPAKPVEDKPSPEDVVKAGKHLAEVAKEVEKLAKDDKGQLKPGCNYYLWQANVLHPLQQQLNNNPNKGVVAKILALKAEEPTVKKFFVNPIKNQR